MNRESSIESQLRRIVGSGGFGQVSITASGASYNLRHVSDRARPDAELRTLRLAELRQLVSTDETTGKFRPLKSAPDLASGWRHAAKGMAGLESALDIIHPGAVADAAALADDTARLQSWSRFASRQTGIYQCVAELTEDESDQVVSTCCDPEFCLRHPVWHRGGESDFPCLAPCAVLLEFARFVAGGAKVDQTGETTAPRAVCEFSNLTNPRTRRFLTLKARR